MKKYLDGYFEKEVELINEIHETQSEKISQAAHIMAEAISSGHLIHVFGSAHSAIPAMEIFPRYGSFIGENGAFHPLLNPRLLWWNVVGTGAVKDLLWLERQKGYIANYLDEQDLQSGDVLLVFSHGGVNAAPVEAAIYAKDHGLKVVAVTSMENQLLVGKQDAKKPKLLDMADIVIDNCVPLEDALVNLDGKREKVGPGSTIAIITITQFIVTQLAGELNEKGLKLDIFVSPNVTEIPPTHNQEVFKKYEKIMNSHKNVK
ncbi:MAG: sugar isomerase domain-containing protein [Thermotogae bacterium]|nr:sugar isomerase domain-containing protein [Thermotogota bacterium]MCL5032702.1 sugar isomerase domain-containing protein [Thermotogota bacterium]